MSDDRREDDEVSEEPVAVPMYPSAVIRSAICKKRTAGFGW